MSLQKVKISQEQLEKFTVKDLVDFGGCPDALKYFSKIYGNKADNLLKYKKDFINLVAVGKSLWVVNFILNILKDEHKKELIIVSIASTSESCEDVYFKNEVITSLSEGKKLLSLDRYYDELLEINHPMHENYVANMVKIYIMKSVKNYIDYVTTNQNNYLLKSFINIIEARVHSNYSNLSFKKECSNTALDLIEYCELWN